MNPRLVKLTCFLLLTIASLKGQGQNPCGVKAILSPGGDSILTAPANITFQSASINATDYKIIIDLYDFGMNQPFTWFIQPGLTTIKLIAYNGTCSDTTISYYFYAGQYPTLADNPRRLYGFGGRDQSITNLTGVSTGGQLVSGHRTASSFFNEPQQGFIFKAKNAGCVEWGKKLVDKYSSDITLIKESADGGFFMVSEFEFGKRSVAKLSAAGNLLWSKSLQASDGSKFITIGLEPMPDAGVTVTGANAGNSNAGVVRLDNTGAILWQREYGYNISSISQFNNILFKNNFLYVGGTLTYNSFTTSGNFLTKINAATGQTVWAKKYTSTTGDFNFRNMLDVDSTILVDIQGPTGVTNVPGIGGFMRLDTAGQVLSAAIIGENYVPNTLVGPYNSGSSQLTRSGKTFYLISTGIHILSLQPGISSEFKIAKIDSSYNVEWVEVNGGAGAAIASFNAPAPDDAVAVAGNENGVAYSPNVLGGYISLKIIDSSGGNTNTSCYYGKQAFEVVPQTINPMPVSWITDAAANYLSVPQSIPLKDFYPEMRFKCPDYVDSCSILKITGPKSVCSLNTIYTYKSHKNKSCRQPTQWEVPPGVQIISQTDSSVLVQFPAFDRYVIYGTNPLSCVPVQDSIVIIAESKTPPLDLGPDQQICPQNNTSLHAGPKFFSYQWQDGSTDSVLVTNQPGQYWVIATDSCANILRDTVNISLAPPVSFSAGPDRKKCNNDTIHIDAQSGFLNYNWNPAYNTNTITGANIIANPQVDTSYTVIAEASPGCFAYDTVKIKVFHSPPINLGIDKSFCLGDSAVFDAGTGFAGYTWSTGAVTEQLSAHTAGQYTVIGTTIDGCKSYDTVKVLQVFPLPVPVLDQNPVICIGTTRVLDAGNFSSYLWNNGNQTSSITINSTGTYSVQVTDANQCKGNASVTVSRVGQSPAYFLPVDTTICSYGTVTLTPLQSFRSYLWNTGSTANSITLTQPGEYTLQVKNNDNCAGKDTILVNPKDCLTGLFVPNAFTPNGDGKNDEFRPLLFGNIKKYRFSVYNRWGNVVFESAIPGKGWDGRNAGVFPGNEVFIWMCSYQLEGESPKMEKGTVVLIK